MADARPTLVHGAAIYAQRVRTVQPPDDRTYSAEVTSFPSNLLHHRSARAAFPHALKYHTIPLPRCQALFREKCQNLRLLFRQNGDLVDCVMDGHQGGLASCLSGNTYPVSCGSAAEDPLNILIVMDVTKVHFTCQHLESDRITGSKRGCNRTYITTGAMNLAIVFHILRVIHIIAFPCSFPVAVRITACNL